MAFHRLISSCLAHSEFAIYGDGRQTRDFTYVSDVVSGTVAAAEHGAVGATYNLAGGARRSMLDVCEVVEDLVGGGLCVRHEGSQVGDARHTSADIALATADLGYEPRYDVRDGLARQIEWQTELFSASDAQTAQAAKANIHRRHGAQRDA